MKIPGFLQVNSQGGGKTLNSSPWFVPAPFGLIPADCGLAAKSRQFPQWLPVWHPFST